MRTKYLATALAVSMLLSAQADAAIKTEQRGGVHGARGTIWFDQIAGEPAVSFPLGCEASGNCNYSIWFEYVRAGENPQLTDIFDRDLSDPDDPMVRSDRCYGWVRVSPTLRTPFMRFSGVEHFFPGNPVPSDDSMLAGGGRHPARRPGPGRSQFGMTTEGSSWVGYRYEMLKVNGWFLEIGDGNCMLGFHACYHTHIKEFENSARRCPLAE